MLTRLISFIDSCLDYLRIDAKHFNMGQANVPNLEMNMLEHVVELLGKCPNTARNWCMFIQLLINPNVISTDSPDFTTKNHDKSSQPKMAKNPSESWRPSEYGEFDHLPLGAKNRFRCISWRAFQLETDTEYVQRVLNPERWDTSTCHIPRILTQHHAAKDVEGT